MSIHECFSGLRDRLGVHGGPVMGLPLLKAAYTLNTPVPSGVAEAAKGESQELQSYKKEETPATQETPSYIYADDDWRERYEERAAIMEFDGGLSRAEAERAAHEFIQHQMRGEDSHVQDPTMH